MTPEIVAQSRSLAHVGHIQPAYHERRVSNQTPTMWAKRAIDATHVQRKLGDLMTPQALQVVLAVYEQHGITMQGIEKRTRLALGSVSRNLMSLGEWHRLGKPGLGLVETVDDPTERRRKIAFLTKKGREFVEIGRAHV